MNAKRHTLANALRVAAVRYMTDAHSVSCVPGHDRLAAEFKQQSREANELADAIEQADTIALAD